MEVAISKYLREIEEAPQLADCKHPIELNKEVELMPGQIPADSLVM